MEHVTETDSWTYLFGPIGPTLLLVAQISLIIIPIIFFYYISKYMIKKYNVLVDLKKEENSVRL